MAVSDKTKGCLSFFLGLSMFVLSAVALAIGWLLWDFRMGLVAALVTFAVCFVLWGLLLASVTDLSWIMVGLPFSMALLYALSPDFIIGPFDDAVVMSAGALMTFGLWLRKQPDAPKWIVIPLLVSGLYTLVGSFIPGPVDELLVAALTVGVSGYGARKRLPVAKGDDGNEDVVEAEFTVQEH